MVRDWGEVMGPLADQLVSEFQHLRWAGTQTLFLSITQGKGKPRWVEPYRIVPVRSYAVTTRGQRATGQMCWKVALHLVNVPTHSTYL